VTIVAEPDSMPMMNDEFEWIAFDLE